SETIEGQTAVVTADIDPFRLFKELEATKSRAPARGGEVAPEDLWVRAGETPFKPGPVVGELQKAGIPAAIERGKVVIRQDKLLVKTHSQALGLAVESEFPTKESIKFLLAKAQAQMLALAARIPSAAGEGDPKNRR